eukprot:2482808-Prymnesium_polylepis.1
MGARLQLCDGAEGCACECFGRVRQRVQGAAACVSRTRSFHCSVHMVVEAADGHQTEVWMRGVGCGAMARPSQPGAELRNTSTRSHPYGLVWPMAD